jgi:hypothetical protein
MLIQLTHTRLTEFVNHISGTILAIPLALEGPAPNPEENLFLTALMSIAGSPPLSVALSSDLRGCQHLAAAMFGCAVENTDFAMVEDALKELVNITTGLIARDIAFDKPLTIARTLPYHEFAAQAATRDWIQLPYSGGGVRLLLSVARKVFSSTENADE